MLETQWECFAAEDRQRFSPSASNLVWGRRFLVIRDCELKSRRVYGALLGSIELSQSRHLPCHLVIGLKTDPAPSAAQELSVRQVHRLGLILLIKANAVCPWIELSRILRIMYLSTALFSY
jgi:hypothetical protein